MIVRNEAHIIQQAIDSAAPFIGSWVIVDTGSDDGTQDLVRKHMAALGIPGELHERQWQDFAHNRNEALSLAQGHGDYIWVLDADDILVGTPEFADLNADIYNLRIRQGASVYWRPQLFRDGLSVRYVGVLHEIPVPEPGHVRVRLEGNYHVESRRLGARNLDARKYERDRDLLLAEVERTPEDTRSVFYLAQSYFDLGDFANARVWYARRVELGGWHEEVYLSMYRLAQSMTRLGEPWPDIQDAYLRAWEFRPTRAEALYAVARRYRVEERYWLGHLFAEPAARIPFPDQDNLFINADTHNWLSTDEQAVCAFWIGRPAEAFTLCRRLLARHDISDFDRQRIMTNRDFSVPAMMEAASTYPHSVVSSLAVRPKTGVAVSLTAGPDPAVTELTLNSFLNCCTDVALVERFVVLDTGLSTQGRARLVERYPFLEFIRPATAQEPGAQLSQYRAQIASRFWLHLGRGWRFFAPEALITRLTAVLDAETQVFQVGINFTDATQLTGASATQQHARRTSDAGRYVLTILPASGPAMFDTARLDQHRRIDRTRSTGVAELRTATLDEILCIARPDDAAASTRVQNRREHAEPGIGATTDTEPIIVVFGPFCGGTSAVAGVLNQLGVFMGRGFDWSYREPHDTWEDSRLSNLCRKAFSEPHGQLQMDPDLLRKGLREWANEHRRAAAAARRPPGVKVPLLCVAIDFLRDTWGPIVPVIVDRPVDKVVASLNRLGWWKDEQERSESTLKLIAARDEALSGTATVRLDFEELRADPAGMIDRLVDELRLDVTDAQTQAAVVSVLQPAEARLDADVNPYEQSRDLLLAEIERHPEDRRAVYLLAQTYYALGDFANVRIWYARQIELGCSQEEAYFAMYRIAEAMERLDEAWPDVQDAYLRAWEFRPTRAEALFFLARRCRAERRYRLGYLFARRAAEIPLPADDAVIDRRDIYTWRADDEQAICAFYVGRHAEAFALCRRLLERPEISDIDRQRIATNRDFSVPAMLESAAAYPGERVAALGSDLRDGDTTVTLIAQPERDITERTLNSFLHCCNDIAHVSRFLILDTGLSTPDRALLQQHYPFLEFAEPATDDAPESHLAQLRALVRGRFWLHLGHGWQFFAPDNLLTRLTAVLDAEPQVLQAAVNFGDAVKLSGSCAAESAVRRTPVAGRYVVSHEIAHGPAMFDTTRLESAHLDATADVLPLPNNVGLRAASLDEVLCIDFV